MLLFCNIIVYICAAAGSVLTSDASNALPVELRAGEPMISEESRLSVSAPDPAEANDTGTNGESLQQSLGRCIQMCQLH